MKLTREQRGGISRARKFHDRAQLILQLYRAGVSLRELADRFSESKRPEDRARYVRGVLRRANELPPAEPKKQRPYPSKSEQLALIEDYHGGLSQHTLSRRLVAMGYGSVHHAEVMMREILVKNGIKPRRGHQAALAAAAQKETAEAKRQEKIDRQMRRKTRADLAASIQHRIRRLEQLPECERRLVRSWA